MPASLSTNRRNSANFTRKMAQSSNSAEAPPKGVAKSNLRRGLSALAFCRLSQAPFDHISLENPGSTICPGKFLMTLAFYFLFSLTLAFYFLFSFDFNEL